MQPKSSIFESSPQFVKGVGPKRVKMLEGLGVRAIWDLIYYFPRRYEDRSHIKPISQVREGNLETIKGRVLTLGTWKPRGKMVIFQLAVDDGSGIIYATWFNQPYLKKRFKVGDEVILSGKVDRFKQLQILTPDYEVISCAKKDSIHTGRIVPIYPSTQDLPQRAIRSIIRSCLDKYSCHLVDWLPLEIRHRRGLIDIQAAIRNIHFPQSADLKDRARQRLIFDEFFLLQLALAIRKQRIKDFPIGIEHKVSVDIVKFLSKILPFELTEAQKRVMDEVTHDMKSPKPMNRLIQGDVGSGKTVIAMSALLLAAENGYQSVFMAPTEILAEQHFMTFEKYLKNLPVRFEILTSKLSPVQRKKVIDKIAKGEVDIVIGTHSIIEPSVKFKNLKLMIIDEQHRFGVRQRAALRHKGEKADMLVMTATPIPRTLFLALYGDLELSILKDMPPGRQKVETSSVQEDTAFKETRIELSKGRQAYIVYPIIEESKVADLKSVKEEFEKVKIIFKDYKTAMLHGRMKSAEKKRIMGEFLNKKIDILVATPVVEVGLDAPGAAIMIINNAERFGLASLHQLRGRVGRSKYKSKCFLISNNLTPDARERINAMCSTSSGFEISEKDSYIRGMGDVLGIRQHGDMDFKIADILRDSDMLKKAIEDKDELLKNDPNLLKRENFPLRRKLLKLYQNKWNIIDLT
ncbi:MAG: ATP-dependent DNA helicase RecG [Elusimicrobiales bacterium]|nr:ATP-dependent DNA helicase RecG [Elusimicrobiales bacterium]